MTDIDHRPDPDDLFADTRMSFGDHLEVLRSHLWSAIYGFLFCMVFSLFLGRPVLYNIFIAPVESQLQIFHHDLRAKRAAQVKTGLETDPDQAANQAQLVDVELHPAQLEALTGNKPIPSLTPEQEAAQEWIKLRMRIPEPVRFGLSMAPAQELIGPQPSMKTFGITEAFMVYFKVSMLCGFVLASPWIFWQIWAFIAAGLYPHEKRYVHIYLPISLVLFIAGACVCQFVVLPKAVAALLWFNEWLNIEPDLRLNEWLGFALAFPIFFGLSFETPLIMMFLERIGICGVDTYRAKRRLAYFVLALVAALGPSIDYFSMMFQWIALCMLYELGIWLCIWSPSRPTMIFSEPEDNALVEA